MDVSPSPIVGYVVHASRPEPGERLRIREFTVGIGDWHKAAAAVIAAFPDLDDGYHVEASIGVTLEELQRFGVAAGDIKIGAETLI